jgi:hypothetical protein
VNGERHNPFKVPRGRLARLGLSFQFPGNRLRYSIRKLLPRPVRWFIYDRLLLKKADKAPIDERAKRHLVDIYPPDLKKLDHLLSRDLSSLRRSWWLTAFSCATWLEGISYELKTNGWLVLDDSDYPVNWRGVDMMERYERIRFTGDSPMALTIAQTGFWKITF